MNPGRIRADGADPTGAPAGRGIVRLAVEPPTSRIDEPLSIVVEGLAPGAPVGLRVRVRDGGHQQWMSWAAMLADDQGRVDAATQAPTDGTYRSVDATGLLWSMTPEGTDRELFFQRRRSTPLQYHATVEDHSGTCVAETSFTRMFGDPELTGVPTGPESGVVGTLYVGPAPGPHPGVLLLGGSDGGQHDHAAALLAGHGHAVLALSYFGTEDTPARLEEIDLDDLGRAVDWLAEHPAVASDRITVLGLSRGGELALQLGAMFPRVAAVIAGAPSSIRQAGLAASPTDFTRPAWVRHGEPLPFVPGSFGLRNVLESVGAWLRGRPMRLRSTFVRLSRPSAQVERARIEVERIRGPVLLLSGTDDQLWPSDTYATEVVERLRRHAHPYDVRHVSYPGAGHFVSCPYGLPTLPPFTRMSVGGRFTMDFGGTPAVNAAAAAAAWTEVLAFLDRLPHGPASD